MTNIFRKTIDDAGASPGNDVDWLQKPYLNATYGLDRYINGRLEKLHLCAHAEGAVQGVHNAMDVV